MDIPDPTPRPFDYENYRAQLEELRSRTFGRFRFQNEWRHFLKILNETNAADRDYRAILTTVLGPEIKDAVTLLLEAMEIDLSSYVLACEAMFAIEQEATPSIIDCIDDDNEFVKFGAVSWFGDTRARRDPEKTIPKLIKAASDPDARFRAKAITVLSTFGAEAIREALPAIIDGINHDNIILRNNCIDALGNYAMGFAVQNTLGVGMEGPSVEEIMPLITQFLCSEDADLRATAVLALSGPAPLSPESVRLIINSIDDSNEFVYDIANRALSWTMQRARTLGPHGMSAIDSVSEAINTRLRTLEVLKLHAPDEAKPLFASLRPHEQGEEQEPVGIERMGDRAVLIKDLLEQFRRVGEICQAQNTDRFSFGKLAELLNESESTLRNCMKKISKFFKVYFGTFENIEIFDDYDHMASSEFKIFDRGERVKPTICRPMGWRAWELTCRFLDRRNDGC